MHQQRSQRTMTDSTRGCRTLFLRFHLCLACIVLRFVFIESGLPSLMLFRTPRHTVYLLKGIMPEMNPCIKQDISKEHERRVHTNYRTPLTFFRLLQHSKFWTWSLGVGVPQESDARGNETVV